MSARVLFDLLALPSLVFLATGYGPRWAGHAALVGCLLYAVTGGWWACRSLYPEELADPGTYYPILAMVVTTRVSSALPFWVVAKLVRERRAHGELLRERARLLEVERGQLARLAESQERGRIVRELHDVVAHSLAVVVAQADGGRYAGDREGAVERALVTIEEVGRATLTELDRLLEDRLAPAADRPSGPEPTSSAQPGIADVEPLVARLRAGGLNVRLRQQGSVARLGPEADLVAFRVVQEGLTNVIKHVGPTAQAEVSLLWGTRELEIEILDDGPGSGVAAPTGMSSGVPAGGHGLMGIRERLAAHGGTVAAAARPCGGHSLRARLPLQGAGSHPERPDRLMTGLP